MKTLNRTKNNWNKFSGNNFQINAPIFLLCLIVYLEVLLSVFTIIQNFSTSNDSLRISVQSLYGFSKQPTSIVLIISLIVFTILLFIFNKIAEKYDQKFIERYVRLIYPSLFLFIIILYRLLFNFENLIGNNGSGVKTVLNEILTGSTWSAIFLLNLVFLISFYFAKIKSIKSYSIYELIGFLSPVVFFVIHQISQIAFSYLVINSEIMARVFVIGILSTMYGLLINFIFQKSQRIESSILSLLILTLSFFVLNIRIPETLYSFRPKFVQIDIDSKRIITVLSVLLILFSISLINTYAKQKNYLITVGGLFFVFTSQFEKIVVPNLDSFHYGEFIGLWFNTKNLNLQPYSEIEYPRGLFVNFLPAEIGNFLSPGNPEIQTYWLFILAYACGILMVYTLSTWIHPRYALLLVFLVPLPNNYVEIDYICFTLVLLTIKMLRTGITKLKIFSLFAFFPILILSFPGQGTLASFLMVVVFLCYSIKNVDQIKFTVIDLVRIFLPISIMYYYLFNPLKAAIIWAFRNSSANSQFFGDGWVNKSLFSENFPVNLRWLVLILPGFILLYYLLNNEKLFFDEKVLLLVSLLYLILISGRWFGRTDFDILSRIGVGALTFCILMLLPAIWRHSSVNNVGLIMVLSLLLFFAAAPFKPLHLIIPNKVFKQNTIDNLSKNYNFVNYGEELIELESLLDQNFNSNQRILNLSGGSAIDFYVKLKSSGGIQSPYMIVDRQQEKDWIRRLDEIRISGFFGPYGGLGGIKADGTSIGGRSPALLSWLMSEFDIFKCGNVSLGVRKSENLYSPTSKLCVSPSTPQDRVELWDALNGGLVDLENSLIMWGKGYPISSELRANKSKQMGIRNSKILQINCGINSTDQEITIIGESAEGTEITSTFRADLIDGQMIVPTEIFPISNLSHLQLRFLTKNGLCETQILN